MDADPSAFLAAFESEPYAAWHAGARLVTADWCEEQGRESDAALLRSLTLPAGAEFRIECPPGDFIARVWLSCVARTAAADFVFRFGAGSVGRGRLERGDTFEWQNSQCLTAGRPFRFAAFWPDLRGTVGVRYRVGTLPRGRRVVLAPTPRVAVAAAIRGLSSPCPPAPTTAAPRAARR